MAATTPYTEIRDSVHGRVDMTPVRDVLHSEPVQRQARIKQLGGVSYIYTGATHSRLAHLIGVCHITMLRAKWLREREQISAEEATNLTIAALVHDVGHDTFSHLIELVRGSHDDTGVQVVLNELSGPIIKGGGSPVEVAKIMRRQSPLSDLIFATPLGADKLDYLVRDPKEALGESSPLDDLFTTHVRWDRDHGLYLLPRGLALVIRTIGHYWYMYTEVYERISVRVVQRYIQELLHQMMTLEEAVSQHLHSGGEDGVMGSIGYWCAKNRTHECAERHSRLLNRSYPKKALVFSPWPHLVPVRYKSTLAKVPCSTSLIQKSEKWSAATIALLERNIAELLGLRPHEISLAPSPPARRWSVPEAKVQIGGRVAPIADVAPQLYTSAELYQCMSRNVVIGIIEDKRDRVVQNRALHKQILDMLELS